MYDSKCYSLSHGLGFYEDLKHLSYSHLRWEKGKSWIMKIEELFKTIECFTELFWRPQRYIDFLPKQVLGNFTNIICICIYTRLTSKPKRSVLGIVVFFLLVKMKNTNIVNNLRSSMREESTIKINTVVWFTVIDHTFIGYLTSRFIRLILSLLELLCCN